MSKDSKTPQEFDITQYVQLGNNTLAVEVFRWSDASYLECQDFWRLSGIPREVYVYAQPKVRLRDFFVQSTLDESYTHGVINLDLELKNHTGKNTTSSVCYEILDDAGKSIASETKTIQPASIKKSEFKFFSNYEIGVDDIQVNQENSYELLMFLSAAVTAGDYVTVSYFPGELAGTDGSLVKAFGPEDLYNPGLETGKIFSTTADNLIEVYPNPASDIINIVCESVPFQIKLINILGAEVYSGSSSSNEMQIDVNKFKSGIYIIKTVDIRHNMNIQKIMLK